jgi:hypothetical protein
VTGSPEKSSIDGGSWRHFLPGQRRYLPRGAAPVGRSQQKNSPLKNIFNFFWGTISSRERENTEISVESGWIKLRENARNMLVAHFQLTVFCL